MPHLTIGSCVHMFTSDANIFRTLSSVDEPHHYFWMYLVSNIRLSTVVMNSG